MSTPLLPTPPISTTPKRAHGPEKDWSKAGFRSNVMLSPRTATLKAAREAGLNLTEVFETAIWALIQPMSEGGLTSVQKELAEAESRVRLLKMVEEEEKVRAQAMTAQAAELTESDAAVNEAVAYWPRRSEMSDADNLEWVANRAKRVGLSPAEFLRRVKAKVGEVQ